MISSEDRILTNQLLIEDLELEEEFTEKSLKDNIQLMKYYRLISQQIDDTLQASVKWIDSPEAKEFFFNEAYYQQEIWESLDEEWDNILSGKYETIDGLLQEIYDYGKAKGYSNIAEHLRYTDTDRLAFAFARNYNYGLIQRLNDDLRGAIKNRLTRAAIEGENPLSLAPKLLKLGVTQLPGSTFTPRQRATMIARTEISRIQNTGILQSYVNEGYTEVKLLTAEDDNVCTLCLRYAYEFNKDDKIIFENRGDERVHNIRDLIKGGAYPPFHPHCRCTYLSVWESKVKPSENVPFTVNLTPINDWEQVFTNTPPQDTPPIILNESLSLEQLNNFTFDELAKFHGIDYQGLETYDYDGKKYHKFVETFDDGRDFVLRFEEGAVKSYLKKGIATPNEIIHEVFKVPLVLRNETREIWFKNTSQGIIHRPTKSGYDSFDQTTAGYNTYSQMASKRFVPEQEDFNHRIVINPKYFKGGGKGRYAFLWNQEEDMITSWKKTIHHEFTHSIDQTKKEWDDNNHIRNCYTDEYSKIHLKSENKDDLSGFTWYANTAREESYAEHGGYISYMLANPTEQKKKITIQYYADEGKITKDINFEEYKQLYPKHYEYFTKKFNEE